MNIEMKCRASKWNPEAIKGGHREYVYHSAEYRRDS
jgi:hypothetical protein